MNISSLDTFGTNPLLTALQSAGQAFNPTASEFQAAFNQDATASAALLQTAGEATSASSILLQTVDQASPLGGDINAGVTDPFGTTDPFGVLLLQSYLSPLASNLFSPPASTPANPGREKDPISVNALLGSDASGAFANGEAATPVPYQLIPAVAEALASYQSRNAFANTSASDGTLNLLA